MYIACNFSYFSNLLNSHYYILALKISPYYHCMLLLTFKHQLKFISEMNLSNFLYITVFDSFSMHRNCQYDLQILLCSFYLDSFLIVDVLFSSRVMTTHSLSFMTGVTEGLISTIRSMLSFL